MNVFIFYFACLIINTWFCFVLYIYIYVYIFYYYSLRAIGFFFIVLFFLRARQIGGLTLGRYSWWKIVEGS